MSAYIGGVPVTPPMEQWMRDIINNPVPPPPLSASPSLPPGPFTPVPTTQTSCSWAPTSKFMATDIDPLLLLADRLRIPRSRGQNITFMGIEHIHVYAAADKVVVLYYKDGVANLLEEDASIFPSDSLVAQFHLIMG